LFARKLIGIQSPEFSFPGLVQKLFSCEPAGTEKKPDCEASSKSAIESINSHKDLLSGEFDIPKMKQSSLRNERFMIQCWKDQLSER
jgi:hypothetical protein